MDKVGNFFKKAWSKTKEFFSACVSGIKRGFRRSVEIMKSPRERALLWDKITTGLLIFVFATPILIIIYIFSWFLSR